MKRIAALSLLLLVAAAISLAPAQQDDTDAFMQVKLKRAQQVIEGLAMEDHALIAKSAQGLLLMSNESNWNVFQTVEYNRLSQEFRDSAARLRKAAQDKNLDGATLAYFEVTLNCVRCHKYTRNTDK